MILPVWRTRIDQTRADEYWDFAHSRWLPDQGSLASSSRHTELNGL